MKKSITIIVLLMTVAMLFCGCLSKATNAEMPELTRGTVSDNIYTSEYADLTFTAPENWVYTSDEEIAELMGVSAELLSDSGLEFDPDILEEQTIYDTMVMDNATGTNVILMYENLAVSGGLGLLIDEEQYMEILKDQLGQTQSYGAISDEITEETVSGNTYKVLSAEIAGVDGTQYYYVRKIGNYIHAIIVTSIGDDVSDIMANFS